MASRLRWGGALLLLLLLAAGCTAASTQGPPEAWATLLLPGESIAAPDRRLLVPFADHPQQLLPEGDALRWRESLRSERPDILLLPLELRSAWLEHDPWFQVHYRLLAEERAGATGWQLYGAIPHPEEEAPWQRRDDRLQTPDGGELRLLAYRLGEPNLRGGEALHLALRWEVAADLSLPLAMEVQLTDADGRLLAREVRWADQLQTERWKAGLTLTTRHRLGLPAELPPGTYALRLAFDPPLALAGETGQTTPLTLTTLTRLPDIRLSPPPSPTHPMSATFGGAIGFLGYDAPLRVPTGGTLPLVLYWQAKAPVPLDAKVFVHLLSAEGVPLAQADAIPVQWRYPTGRWQVGEFICDAHRLDLAEVPRGDYRLTIGFYDPATGERLPVIGEAADPAQRYLLLGLVAVR